MRLALKSNIVWRLCKEQTRCLPGSLPRIITLARQVSMCLLGPAKRRLVWPQTMLVPPTPIRWTPSVDAFQLLGRASVPCWFCKCPCILLSYIFAKCSTPSSWLLTPSLFSRQHILFFRSETGTFALSSLFWELINTLEDCGTYHQPSWVWWQGRECTIGALTILFSGYSFG